MDLNKIRIENQINSNYEFFKRKLIKENALRIEPDSWAGTCRSGIGHVGERNCRGRADCGPSQER